MLPLSSDDLPPQARCRGDSHEYNAQVRTLDVPVQFLDVATLFVFLAALVGGAGLAVNSISKLSKLMGISELSAGLVIVSVATSTPELAVGVASATTGNIGITLGDVFGSNVTNIALIGGLLLLLTPIRRIEPAATRRLSYELIIASLIPFLLLVAAEGSRLIGASLLAFFALFVYRIVKSDDRQPTESRPTGSPFRPLVLFLLAIALVVVSARLVVGSASSIAEAAGIRPSIVGATIVSMGTSLPELSVDVVAVRRRHLGLALGDILGSCVTNTTLVLGLVLAVSQVRVSFLVLSDLMTFATASPIVIFLLLRGGRISYWKGLALVALYVVFIGNAYELISIA
jgi:cation:H+ antiporter